MLKMTMAGMILLAICGCQLMPVCPKEMQHPMAQIENMVFVPAQVAQVGSTAEERAQTAKLYDCDPSWLNDDLASSTFETSGFWIDRYPVTNSQYLAFAEKTGARLPWPNGSFSANQADYPVVDISHDEAAAYAAWVGKRLPSAQEWEMAAQSHDKSLFPWGTDWPGPIKIPKGSISRCLNEGIGPVGQHKFSSRWGMGDAAALVCEHTSNVIEVPYRPNEPLIFTLTKGISWLHRDPLNFRVAATSVVYHAYSSPLIGFRCALDKDRLPASMPAAQAPKPSDETARVEPESISNEIFLKQAGPRYLFVYTPLSANPTAHLAVPEVLAWNGQSLINFDRQFEVGWKEGPRQLSWRMGKEAMRLEVKVVPGNDWVDRIFVVENNGSESGVLTGSCCFNLSSLPFIYDPEMLRTYVLTPQGEMEKARRFPRRDSLVHWISPIQVTPDGTQLDRALIGVESTDSCFVIGSGRAEPGAAHAISENSWFNCFHTDAPVKVGPGARYVSLQRFYFLRGSIETLRRRFQSDCAAGVFAGDGPVIVIGK
jgi:formylglycine-generating enzyme required for sulfatase activity